jgi:solute carrier family 25 carnitine/acylcarnitine transporter 20/29
VQSKRTYGSIPQTVSKLYAQGGVTRFYTGLAPCLLRSVPANAMMLTVVDSVGRQLSKLMGL